MSLQAILKTAREVKSHIESAKNQHIFFYDDHIEVKAFPHNLIYRPSTTGSAFHTDDTFVKLIFGPYGSGKSTACCFDIVKRACQMPMWYQGRRKSRFIIIRNTSGELYSTTLQTWLVWFSGLGDINKRQKPLLTYEHLFNDGKGMVELELIFIALDREQDVRKIKSLEATGCYINELSEVPQGALSHLKGRVNHRYPGPAFCPEPYWSGIIADTNPPDTDHWIFNDFESKALSNYRIFRQPPGLIMGADGEWLRNPEADNAENLSKDYYLKLAEGQTKDFVKVFCLGEYGSVGFGKQVYPEYNDALHAVDDIKYDDLLPLYLGFDFGLTPACIVCQFSARGQLRALKEYTADGMGIRTFAESIVLPAIAQEFPNARIVNVLCDPAGVARDNILEELSCISELVSLGLPAIAARTNEIDPRLGAVRFFLNRMANGQPSFVLSRTGCPVLRKGFIKDYAYRRLRRVAVSTEERYHDKPQKNAASHVHDSLQYVALDFATDAITKAATPKTQVDMSNPVFRWG